MNRGASLLVVFTLAVGYALLGFGSTAQAQTFTGKWIHKGPKGVSTIEFFPGEKHILGPMRGTFRHTIVLDDGRIIQGEGHYVFRSIAPNRGWLTLNFSDGQVTHEHEHITTEATMNLRHHGLTRIYVRQ